MTHSELIWQKLLFQFGQLWIWSFFPNWGWLLTVPNRGNRYYNLILEDIIMLELYIYLHDLTECISTEAISILATLIWFLPPWFDIEGFAFRWVCSDRRLGKADLNLLSQLKIINRSQSGKINYQKKKKKQRRCFSCIFFFFFVFLDALEMALGEVICCPLCYRPSSLLCFAHSELIRLP